MLLLSSMSMLEMLLIICMWTKSMILMLLNGSVNLDIIGRMIIVWQNVCKLFFLMDINIWEILWDLLSHHSQINATWLWWELWNWILEVLLLGLQGQEKLKLPKIWQRLWPNNALYSTVQIPWISLWLVNFSKGLHLLELGHALISLTELIFKFCPLSPNNYWFYLQRKAKNRQEFSSKEVKLN